MDKRIFLKIAFFALLFISTIKISAQNGKVFELDWKSNLMYGLEGEQNQRALNFTDAQYDFATSNVPFYVIDFDGVLYESVSLKNVQVFSLSSEEATLINVENIPSDFELQLDKITVKKRESSSLKITPIRNSASGGLEKLVSFELETSTPIKSKINRSKSLTFASQSALASGEWYKIAVVNEGVFRLTRTFLKNLGIDVDNIDPRNLKLYGYGGGMLPESNSESRPDDMQENAIFVSGEQDGSFDAQDFILFYGEDQVDWKYDETREMFRHQLNLYSDTSYYFINVGVTPGKRIVKLPSSGNTPIAFVNEFDSYAYYERDNTNLLKSGREWFGEIYDNVLNYSFQFNSPNTVTSKPGKIELYVIARAGIRSAFTLNVNNQNFITDMGSVNLNRYDLNFARASRKFFDFTPNNGLITMNLGYNKPQTVAKGWLNFITLNVRRRLIVSDSQLQFRDTETLVTNGVGTEEAEFQIQALPTIKVWDISDKYNIAEMDVKQRGNLNVFQGNISSLREYIAFEKADTTSVFPMGKVVNQNLHGLPQADLLIIAHPKFLTSANRVAGVHASEGLVVNVVTPQQIFNEFSSGSQDLVAIRTFIKMFYDRATNVSNEPKYVLMIGDASYDYKNRIAGNTNYIPAYQSPNSLDPVASHVSDDFIGFLDDSEGLWESISVDRMDVAIGRFPVQTLAESEGIANKLEVYYSKGTMGDWRNKIVFVGDDEDGVTHMSQSNLLSKIVEDSAKSFNSQKIFLDAYQQQSTASGARYPEVTEDLVQTVEDGALFVNYTGHGGETGWTGERVLGILEITNWKNINNLPVFITATCEFSRFDDPLRTSGGELVLLNPKGGGIGLMTTTRLVFSSPNYLMNRTFYDNVFKKDANGNVQRLGDIFLTVKNFNAYSSNSRNFSLLGDPAIRMAMPKENVVSTLINGKPLSQLDTLNALSTVTITGMIQDHNGNKITDFNGFVYPTVFDKAEIKSTLNNDGGGVFKFETRDRRIFKGKATVTNGDFSFTFVVPKDISYSFGTGKISYYAENKNVDANGYSEDFIIGGSNPNIVEDDQGPEMELFMNDESFIFGGITDNNPKLLVKLDDDQGINTVGSGIGHDLVAILDEDTENAFILNDYYEASVDDHTKGIVNFPFSDLPEGKHVLRVKAWDVANNSSEKSIEFNVMKDTEVEIENLVNYPNPFTTNTEFIFQHNQAGVVLDVKLEVFTISGKLVKSIDKMVVNEGFVSRDIRWDGRDDFGDRIGKGVYMYKLKIRSANGSTSEKYEKLVIL